MPAMMPSTARPVVTVVETLMLSNGKSPVRINHSPSKIIPKFLPAKLFVSAISSPFLNTVRVMSPPANAGGTDKAPLITQDGTQCKL